MSEPHNSEALANDLLFYSPSKKTNLLNPVVLAYVGDSVFELLVRQYLVSLPNHKPHHLHREATGIVSAKAQRRILLEHWQPLLTEEEADVVRRGRNTKSGAPPKNADPADYRQATALECLVGYLYYEGRIQRLHELFACAIAAREDGEERPAQPAAPPTAAKKTKEGE
ncbi:ribonuclease III domain-containing protein [Paenibacillus sp. BIHB 4019]|uniref:Mini-ribonuclease 3 n=1 Tax=Paenibacillus sp. BIHB 4019 TaxID=1870819 RepID=UPI000C15A81C|nr:ribonuclease III domain-containing protein [Paenibacillus sp. BIHB 4019]